MVRPYNNLLSLIHHGYHHLLRHLQAYVRKLRVTEVTSGRTPSLARNWRPKIKNYLKKLEEEEYEKEILRDQLAKVEIALEEEHMRATEEAEERKRLEAHFLEAKVEAGGLKKKLEMYLGEGPATDPQLLKIALSKCREELSSKTRVLQDMERQYREVVPRADFDRLQRKFAAVSNSHKQVTMVHDMLKDQHETVLAAHEKVVAERDGLREENQTLRRAATPRPDWNRSCWKILFLIVNKLSRTISNQISLCRVAEYLEGGISRWRELSFGKTSEQMVDVLISELTGSQLCVTSEFIDCKGKEPGVPAYLRYEGSVRNRCLGKRDLMLIVEDIWAVKRKLNNKEPMEVFVDTYFKERYHLEEVRAEWCYSLADACQRLAHEEQVL
ncbi:hypothetical protein SK128_012912 [Halocaridina rubra]|uniref:Translin-associated factor X-interacting protein 1 N-terminal domain-containing protein n=1 Tax=Halocaridina rubra TaxID=373956 RepID=A0AAN9A0B8_HALRR